MPFLRTDIEQSIVARFADQVARHAHRTAVLTPYEQWSYAELDRQTDAIAAGIVDRIGQTDAPVALGLGQGARLVAAVVGVLKAGKCYVPIEPSDPLARRREILAASEPALFITDHATDRPVALNGHETGLLHDGAIPVWHLDAAPARSEAKAPNVLVDKFDPAYVFFTSGTTGRPKGVLDVHRNVLHNIYRYTNALGIGSSDRLTLIQSPSFSGTVSSLFCALLNGATLLPFDVRRGGFRRLAQWLRASRATIYHSVPSIFRGLVAAGGPFPDVRVVRLEGDGATREDFDLFRRAFSAQCVLAHGLGATETGLSCQFQATEATRWEGERMPIGHPLPDIELRIVDEHGVTRPDGAAGEIEVSSEFLAAGYWRDPALTATRFIDAGRGAARRFRTGDLGMRRADGRIYHLGRADEQFKINGQWVSTVEVEAALGSLGAFRDVLVMARRDGAGPARLVAYLVLAIGVEEDPSTWRAALFNRLPFHMIPSVFVVVESFPLTEHGKIDRGALPAPTLATRVPDGVARSQVERDMVAIWEETLEVRPIGIRDNFFVLGGDSLRAALVMSRIEARVGRAIAPTALLAAPTIERLVQQIEASARLGDAAEGADGAEGQAPLVVLRAHGAQAPLFFVDWPGAQGWQLGGLAHRLGDDQPCYVIASGGIPTPWPQGTTVEQLAAAVIRLIRVVQPTGDVRLVGHCYGGIIALEAAHQLHARSEAVSPLVMLGVGPKDFPTLIGPPALRISRRRQTLERWVRWRQAFQQRGVRASIRTLTGKLRRLGLSAAARVVPARHFDHPATTPFDVRAASEQAARSHRPTPHLGDVLCLLSEGLMRPMADAGPSCWSRLGARVTVHALPGEDTDLLVEPAVSETARLLRQALGRF